MKYEIEKQITKIAIIGSRVSNSIYVKLRIFFDFNARQLFSFFSNYGMREITHLHPESGVGGRMSLGAD